ncbi:membrane-associating domain-containing protein [Hirsutella rhossiliensis]
MAALDRIVSMILRAAQIGFAVIVAAIIGAHLHRADSSAWSMARLIYTEVVAGIAIFLGLIWLLPFSSTFTHWPVDIFVSVLWWVAFGLLVNLVGTSCGAVFDWQNVSPRGDRCGKFKANIAFAFLSAVVWLASAGIGLFWVSRHQRRDASARSRV